MLRHVEKCWERVPFSPKRDQARSLEEQLFCLWQNLVDFTRNDRASALRTQHLLMKARKCEKCPSYRSLSCRKIVKPSMDPQCCPMLSQQVSEALANSFLKQTPCDNLIQFVTCDMIDMSMHLRLSWFWKLEALSPCRHDRHFRASRDIGKIDLQRPLPTTKRGHL